MGPTYTKRLSAGEAFEFFLSQGYSGRDAGFLAERSVSDPTYTLYTTEVSAEPVHSIYEYE